MILKLKGGESREFAAGLSGIEIARQISEGLARAACAVSINGEAQDLRTVPEEGADFGVLTFDDAEGAAAFRHTTSHILAQAVKRLFPEAKLAIGPSIKDGFYYDFEFAEPLKPEDLEKIEKEMAKIVSENLEITRFTLPRSEAIALMEQKGEPYKVQLILDLPEDAELSFYQQGDYVDLCAGPASDEHQAGQGIQADFHSRALTGAAMSTIRCSPASTAPASPRNPCWRNICSASEEASAVTTESWARNWVCS